jgi:hypothetical protein
MIGVARANQRDAQVRLNDNLDQIENNCEHFKEECAKKYSGMTDVVEYHNPKNNLTCTYGKVECYFTCRCNFSCRALVNAERGDDTPRKGVSAIGHVGWLTRDPIWAPTYPWRSCERDY